MSIIFDALKKVQGKLSGHPPKTLPPEKKEEITKEPKFVTPFYEQEDLTQPIKPIPGAKPLKETIKSDSKTAKRPVRARTIYDVRKMNPIAFIFLIVFGLLGSALVFYLFSIKMKDKYLIVVPQEKVVNTPSVKSQGNSTPANAENSKAPSRNMFLLSPEVTLSLGGIMSSDGENVALIDDQIVLVGDTIKGAKIIAITPTEVILLFQGKEITMTLKK
jgi:hypothetical protein